MIKGKVGINENVNLKILDIDERKIVDFFAKDWYITICKEISIVNSRYKAFMMKPNDIYSQKFNLERELIVVFSSYSSFEPRTIDAIDEAIIEFSTTIQKLRLEEICSVIVSKDENIEAKIENLLKTSKESKVIVPFSYKELLANTHSAFFIENRFRKHFYSRDLFGFKSAIQKESYFFGRRDLVQELANLHLSGECSGIFGLRKTGKTSIIFSLERNLSDQKIPSIFIDCQDTAVYKKRWYKLLHYIISKLASKYGVKMVSTSEEYLEATASEKFASDLKYIYNQKSSKPILIMFDEIERISFRVADENHWKNGEDFIAFWRTMRAVFQESKNVFSYMIAGTNAMCIEERSISKIDNPIYNQIRGQYITQFDVKAVTAMLNKLGGYMGIKFDDIVCANLTQDYGGHPFLIRQVCSVINESIRDSERPIYIQRIDYEKAKPRFEKKFGNEYSALILDVLKDYYEFEYLMLKHLALGNIDFFNEHALSSDSDFYTSHLIDYGILMRKKDNFDFCIDTLKKYLIDKNKFQKIKLTNKEKLAEISERRNNMEPKLRKMARNVLQATLGEEKAKEIAIKKLHKNNINKFSSFEYRDLFNPNISEEIELYWSKIADLMYQTWEDSFKNIFDKDKEKFRARMTIINELRVDAHAKDIEDYDMESFRGAMTWLEIIVTNYES